MTFITYSDEDMKRLGEIMASVGDEWAAGLDGEGKPGTDILNAFRAALAAN